MKKNKNHKKEINQKQHKKHIEKLPEIRLEDIAEREEKITSENNNIELQEKEIKTDQQIEYEKRELLAKITGQPIKQDRPSLQEQINKIVPEEEVNKNLETVSKVLKKEEKEVLKERITTQLWTEKVQRKRLITRNLGVIAISLILGLAIYLTTKSLIGSAIFFAAALILFGFSSIIKKNLERNQRIKTMETVFPDFIELVASNLRAGMTVEKSLLLSSKKEFAPLDKEILQLGKDVATGKEIALALQEMAKRTESEKISKTVSLIISGIKSGGNMSILLNETAVNMRQREFIEKKAASNIVMYKIFIIFAISVGAPILFGLSSILVEIMHNLLSSVTVTEGTLSVPFTISQINISLEFIIYYAIVFLIVTDVLASLLIGLITKGKESEGFRYTLWIIMASLAIFFATRYVMGLYFSGLFGS